MAKNDMYNNITPNIAMTAGTYADQAQAFTGEVIDMQGYESVTFFLFTANAANPGSNINVQLFESDDNFATNNLVADADLIGSFPDDIDGTVAFFQDNLWKLGYIGKKRYLQLALTVANTLATDGLPISAAAVQGDPHTAPTPVTPIAP